MQGGSRRREIEARGFVIVRYFMILSLSLSLTWACEGACSVLAVRTGAGVSDRAGAGAGLGASAAASGGAAARAPRAPGVPGSWKKCVGKFQPQPKIMVVHASFPAFVWILLLKSYFYGFLQ